MLYNVVILISRVDFLEIVEKPIEITEWEVACPNFQAACQQKPSIFRSDSSFSM